MVAIPLAAGVLYGVGVILSPAVGALLMSLSTVIVAVNATLLHVEKPAENRERGNREPSRQDSDDEGSQAGRG